MEEHFKAIIRISRDAICENGSRALCEARKTVHKTGQTVLELARYVGVNDDKLQKINELAEFFKQKFEADFVISRVDVAAANIYFDDCVKQFIKEHARRSRFGYENPIHISTCFVIARPFNRGEQCGDAEHKQRLLSAIIWNSRLVENRLGANNEYSKEEKQAKVDDEKIRNWNKRIDEVDIVRKCGSPDHLGLKGMDEKNNRNAFTKIVDNEVDVLNNVQMISKLKKKCVGLKRFLGSKKTIPIKGVGHEEHGIQASPCDNIKDNVDISNNSTEGCVARPHSHQRQVSKHAKETSNRKRLSSDKLDVDKDGDDDDVITDDDQAALTIQVPSNVRKIILIKNGCRISVEV